jgi:hypothetical protein
MLCSIGSQVLHGCQSPLKCPVCHQVCLPDQDHYPRLRQALLAGMQHHFWNLLYDLVLLALADDDKELELKTKTS